MKKNTKQAIRRFAGLAAVASAVAAVQSVKAADNAVTISISGSTAMRNFTTSSGFTLVEPGTSVTIGGTTYGGAAYWGSGTNVLLQLAPDNSGFATSGAGTDQVAALTVQWHEQGSVEGVLDLVNDQISALPTNTGTRNPTTANPIWINRNKFTAPGSAHGYTIDNFGNPNGQARVQMAISDVNGSQGFSTIGAGASWNRTVGQSGYGKGNQALTAPSATNLSGLGIAGGQVQLVDAFTLNLGANLADGTPVAAGVWNTAGTGNLENNKVAATATLFVANPGTGLDKVNRTDAQWLQTSSRFSNGAGFNFTSRDVNSGTRNVAASNTGVDVSFAVGLNDGGTGASSESLIGSGIKFSNKTTGGNLRTTVQNNRLAIGTLGLSDALASTQGGATPLRGLDYSDSTDGSTGYVRASAQTIVDGSYAIWQNETYITVKAPDAQYGNTNGANVLGDTVNGDVKAVRNNILLSSKDYTGLSGTNFVFGPSDALLVNSFIPEQLLVKSKTLDGVGNTVNSSAYNASNSASFLGNGALTAKFNVGNGNSPNSITTGTGSYASTLATGTNAIGITADNYLVGNFNKNGTRDLASLKAALAASTALEGLASGTNGNSANGSLINSTIVNYGTNTATKGDLIVMGDVAGSGRFDGKSLYLLAKNAALSDNLGTDNLTFGGGSTLGDAIRTGVSRKNDALDYLHANATLQQKTDAAVNPADPVSVANAFNKFDINRDGRISRNDAAIVDKFVGASKTDLTTQVGATIASDGSVSTTLTQRSINLYDVGLIDGTSTITTGTYTGSGASVTVGTPGDFASIRKELGVHLKAGDTAFRGSVDIADIRQIVRRGFYNDGLTTHKWSDGDFTGDGAVNISDIRAIVQAGVYNGGNYDGGLPSVATPSLSGRTASPATTTLGSIGDGTKLHFVYDPSNGDVTVKYDGVTGNVQELHLASTGTSFIVGSVIGFNGGFDNKASNDLDTIITSGFFANGLDLGHILAPNLPTATLLHDLTLSYSVQGLNLPDGNSNLIVGVPEPTTLSLIGMGAVGLLARRKRSVKK